LVARLSSQVVCGAVQASSGAAQEQQLEAALKLLDDLAAGEALGRRSRLDARGPAWRLVKHLAGALQACSASPAVCRFVQQRLLAAVAEPPADACAAAVLTARVHLVRMLQLPAGPGVAAFCSSCLEQVVSQLQPLTSWLMRHQEQQQQQAAAAPFLLPAEECLLNAHVGWLLEAAQLAARQLQANAGGGPTECTQAAAGPCMQHAAAAALSALELSTRAGGGSQSVMMGAEGPSGAGQLYTGPALRLLVAASSGLQAAALERLQEQLERLAQAGHQSNNQQQQQQQELLVDVAAAAGVLGGAKTQPQALFRSLLASPDWAVRAAALDALVHYSRTSAVHGTFLGLIPPECMASASAATPAFISIFKAHMQRSPDDQVCVCVLLAFCMRAVEAASKSGVQMKCGGVFALILSALSHSLPLITRTTPHVLHPH